MSIKQPYHFQVLQDIQYLQKSPQPQRGGALYCFLAVLSDCQCLITSFTAFSHPIFKLLSLRAGQRRKMERANQGKSEYSTTQQPFQHYSALILGVHETIITSQVPRNCCSGSVLPNGFPSHVKKNTNRYSLLFIAPHCSGIAVAIL